MKINWIYYILFSLYKYLSVLTDNFNLISLNIIINNNLCLYFNQLEFLKYPFTRNIKFENIRGCKTCKQGFVVKTK